MPTDPFIQAILTEIETIWRESGVTPEYQEAIRRAFWEGSGPETDQEPGWLRLALLFPTCCQAAGGRGEDTQAAAAAWLMYYAAAHLMDGIEDDDPPGPWQAAVGPGVALNAATGLYFCAEQALDRLLFGQGLSPAALQIQAAFHRAFLYMCNGQHADLNGRRPDLAHFWQNATAKSGAFFALACWAGARLACPDQAELNPVEQQRLQAYYRFGEHIGLLIQILDDVEEIKPTHASWTPRWPEACRSLAVTYAAEVLPAEGFRSLSAALQAASLDPQATPAALKLLEACGATLYIKLEIERQHNLALQALQEASPQASAQLALEALLGRFSACLQEAG